MGTITAQTIVSEVLTLLGDDSDTPVTWSKAELLTYLNSGQRKIATMKPEAWPVKREFVLVEGTYQTIPYGHAILDVLCNMGTGGATPGNAIKKQSRKFLDDEYPGWHSYTASATVEFWIYNPKYPKQFMVFPPQPSSGFGYVRAVLAEMPTAVSVSDWGGSDVITLDDVYENSLMDWICFKAKSKEAEDSYNEAQALKYYEAFVNALGVQDAVEEVNKPSTDG